MARTVTGLTRPGPLQPRVGRQVILRGIWRFGSAEAIPDGPGDRRTSRDWHRGGRRKRRWVLTTSCNPESVASRSKMPCSSFVASSRMPIREPPIAVREEQEDLGPSFRETTGRKNAKAVTERNVYSGLPRRHLRFAPRLCSSRHPAIALSPNDLAAQRRRAASFAATAGWTAGYFP